MLLYLKLMQKFALIFIYASKKVNKISAPSKSPPAGETFYNQLRKKSL